MIYGVGTDIVEIRRIARAMEKSDHFLKRYYTEQEQAFLQERGIRQVQSAAMNFAGKEAVAKALRTGINRDVRLEQIEILREPSGAPYVVLHEETLQYAGQCGVDRIHISLSDTLSLATAYVVAEQKEKE